MHKLTKNEEKVLKELHNNCRESKNVIAKKCNISRSGLDKMINKFLKTKHIIIITLY